MPSLYVPPEVDTLPPSPALTVNVYWVTIVEGDLTITPRLWADNTDTFFQAGAMFETGSGKAVIGARMSDLTHEINTQLVEFFAEVKVEFD